MKSIVVAYDMARGIGAENDLLWQRELPADLRHFKELTMGHAIIMGRKTFESIGRALPHRQNIVISRQPLVIDGVTIVGSVAEAYSTAKSENVFVIGGGEIYKQTLQDMDRIYATEVAAVFDNATVFFPSLDSMEWHEVSREKHEADERNMYNYDFVIYERL